MKALRTLMRLARAEADALRARLADAEAEHVKALARIAMLEAGILDEQSVAVRDRFAGSIYGPYAAARKEDRRMLKAEEVACTAHADALRAELAAAFLEFKKLERLIEMAEARAAEAERALDQAQTDEAATLRAGRRRGFGTLND